MRVLMISNTPTDLAAAARRVPFLSSFTVAGINFTGGALTVQESHVDDDGWTTVGVVPAAGAAELTIRKQFVRVSTAANVTLIGK